MCILHRVCSYAPTGRSVGLTGTYLEQNDMIRRGRPSGKRGRNRRGMFAFEWVLATAFLAIGLVGGVYAVRGAIVNHYKSLLECICKVDVCECIECDDCDCTP